MPMKIVADEIGRSKIILEDEPDWIVPLLIAPEKIEDFLLTGKWLIISMSVWSGPDRAAGGLAILQARKFRGEIKLGLRPYDYFEEHESWIPDFKRTLHPDTGKVVVSSNVDQTSISIRPVPGMSPIMLTFIDGQLAKLHQGSLSKLEMFRYFKQISLT
jgi:hypothetical protein